MGKLTTSIKGFSILGIHTNGSTAESIQPQLASSLVKSSIVSNFERNSVAVIWKALSFDIFHSPFQLHPSFPLSLSLFRLLSLRHTLLPSPSPLHPFLPLSLSFFLSLPSVFFFFPFFLNGFRSPLTFSSPHPSLSSFQCNCVCPSNFLSVCLSVCLSHSLFVSPPFIMCASVSSFLCVCLSLSLFPLPSRFLSLLPSPSPYLCVCCISLTLSFSCCLFLSLSFSPFPCFYVCLSPISLCLFLNHSLSLSSICVCLFSLSSLSNVGSLVGYLQDIKVFNII